MAYFDEFGKNTNGRIKVIVTNGINGTQNVLEILGSVVDETGSSYSATGDFLKYGFIFMVWFPTLVVLN